MAKKGMSRPDTDDLFADGMEGDKKQDNETDRTSQNQVKRT